MLRKGTYVDGTVFLGLQIAEALAHAHRAGVLHLDLKPSNILLTASGCPKILDFNLASDSQACAPRLGGTLPYMSPEQARRFLDGEEAAAIDQRSDLYSFGVLFHELLCGRLPHGNGPADAVVARGGRRSARGKSTTRCTHLGRVRREQRLASIVERCLAPDPNARYESADALVADLQRELSLLSRTRRWLRAHRRSVLSVAAIILAFGVCLTAPLDTSAVSGA